MSSLCYEKLQVNSREIRILSLLPGRWLSPIRTTLKKISLDDDIVKYCAVSYAWGDPNDTKSIFVGDVPLQIPCNLENCLQHLRRQEVTLLLWADSVCINQRNSQEKSQQILMMSEIFRGCSTTFIWLGVPAAINISDFEIHSLATKDETGPEADPFSIIHHFAQDRHFFELPCFRNAVDSGTICFTEDGNFGDTWEAFKDALQKPWWSRFWCVQECLLSTSAILVLGKWTMPWSDVKLCEINYQRHLSSCCLTSSSLMPEKYTFYPDMTVVATDSREMSLKPQKTWSELDLLLRSFSYKACQNPRDKVFGILGLVDPSLYANIAVDYSLSTCSVYVSVMRAMLLEGKGDLQSLTGFGFNSRQHDLPSWVRDFSAQPDIGSLAHDLKRFESYKIYDAAKSTVAFPTIKDNMLQLDGILVDKISCVKDPVRSRSWEHIKKVIQTWHGVAGIDFSDPMCQSSLTMQKQKTFWYTLMRGALYEGDRGWRKIADDDVKGLYCWLSNMRESLRAGRDPLMTSWLKTMLYSIYDQAMFRTERDTIGICGPEGRPGDELWVLRGGNVPFILRPYQNITQTTKVVHQHYTLIGDAYVHEIMDGHAFPTKLSSNTRIVIE